MQISHYNPSRLIFTAAFHHLHKANYFYSITQEKTKDLFNFSWLTKISPIFCSFSEVSLLMWRQGISCALGMHWSLSSLFIHHIFPELDVYFSEAFIHANNIQFPPHYITKERWLQKIKIFTMLKFISCSAITDLGRYSISYQSLLHDPGLPARINYGL